MSKKKDNSLVSQVDLYISDLIKQEIFGQKKFSSYMFLSEEEHSGTLKFPAAILDPIDGTMEMVQGIPECAVSLGLFEESSLYSTRNISWILNPFTGMEIFSTPHLPPSRWGRPDKLVGMVSRREWQEGTFRDFSFPEIILFPRGSVAFKLGLLAAGACDFVVSLRPKNIWDIAAGTNLCGQRGLEFYEGGNRITHLEKMVYLPPLIWCWEKDWNKLSGIFTHGTV